MVDILNIPLYYIGFEENPSLKKNLENIGFTDINHSKSTDGRKMNPEKLVNDNIIGVRAYNDLIYGRSDLTSITSLGTVGCSLSHIKLWKMCVENNMPYIIIAEDDLKIDKISPDDIKNIQTSLSYPNGAFISSNFIPGDQTIVGLHLYFLTQGAAKALLKKAFPIDMQTDAYVGLMNNTKEIRASGYEIGKQDKSRVSSTGAQPFGCIKCNLPTGNLFYLLVVLFVVLIIVMSYFLYKALTKTKLELESCRSSRSMSSD